MLHLVIALENCYRERFDVPQELNTQKNVYISFSERGIQKYGEQNLNKAFEGLMNKELGDIVFNLAQIDFQINRLRILDMENPKLWIQLMEESNSAFAMLNNLGLRLHFEFVIKHNVYPFWFDSGDGQLHLSISDIRFLVAASQSEECPGELSLSQADSFCNIDKLDIVFNSNLSYIYNAIMPILTDYLRSLFNEKLATTFVAQMIDFANQHFRELNPVCGLYDDSNVKFDQRWIGDVQVIDRQFYIPISGQACFEKRWEDDCIGKTRKDAPPRPLYMLNSDVTYEISIDVFNSAFAFITELNETYYTTELGIEQLEVKIDKVVNMGIITNITYVRDGERRLFQTIGKLKTKQHMLGGTVVAWFGTTVDKVVYLENEDKETAQKLAAAVSQLIVDYAYGLINGFKIDLANASIVYAAPNWVVVGAEVSPEAL